ncbi:MAG: lipoate--protein ligase [Muribaculaceae bacterium]|nr:lipoate--protein ligase [Muribaculaceae bacterium]
MIYVSPYQQEVKRQLPYYLAMEEYIARNRPEDDLWFMWIVDPTVIIGRNQLLQKEVNIEYCKSRGIDLVRRKSGGGCVYADAGNIMFSYICHSNEVETTFRRYTSRIAEMLCSLGLNAEATGRNDVTVDGLKVSGNAFYHIPGRSIVHGTMLFDTDFEVMAHAICPPAIKLQSKGIDSVRSRVCMLADKLDMDIRQFQDAVRSYLSDSEIVLTADDDMAIQEIAATYRQPEWFNGHNPQADFSYVKRIDGVGTVQADIKVKGGCIASMILSGDFFELQSLSFIYDRLAGVVYDRESVQLALADIDVGQYIANLMTNEFINIIF